MKLCHPVVTVAEPLPISCRRCNSFAEIKTACRSSCNTLAEIQQASCKPCNRLAERKTIGSPIKNEKKMMEIQKTDFSKFLQNQDFALHSLILAEVKTLTDEHLPSVVTPYGEALDHFDQMLKTGGTSPHSKRIAELDKKRDDVYTGMAAHTRNMKKHFDAEKAETAYQAEVIIKRYGNPTRLPYLQEDAVLKNLITDLRAFGNAATEPGEDAQAADGATDRLAAIGLTEWVEQLETVNNEFMALYSQRNEEDAATETGATKAARTATDEAWYAVARRINSLVDIFGEAAFKEVINNINQLIDKELATLATHRTNVAKRNAKEEAEAAHEA